MATVHTLRLAFNRMADQARLNGSSLAPMITTDPTSARILVEALAEDLGCDPYHLMPSDQDEVYGMYDGISIVARMSIICKRPVDGWREYFGALAEIWEA